MSCLTRHEIRTWAMICLYQHLLLKRELSAIVGDIDSLSECFDQQISQPVQDPNTDLANDSYFQSLIQHFNQNEDTLLQEVSSHLSKGWAFNRLSAIEQAILLLAATEIKAKKVDKPVAIDEAVSLAKMYCDETAYRYINGVLDKL
ncbi:MAG: transcription antitermination factor NusB [Erysipelotrichaceae bacterium]|jgi:N utilization substance protein B|nr:transcription antitermination factor NusB [Erysipelotrichaceae bacterium]